VVESAIFGVAASGSGISAGNSFAPIFLALPADKREEGDAHLYLAFTGYNGINPPVSHSKQELFGHRLDLPPVNCPEHYYLPKANS